MISAQEREKSILCTVLFAMIVMLVPGLSQGAPLYGGNLAGDQEVPAVSTAASGSVSAVLNGTEDALQIRITISGLDLDGNQTPADSSDDVTGAHIHRAPAGTNGPVVYGLFSPGSDLDGDLLIDAVNGTITVEWDAGEGNGTTLASELDNLRSGQLYVNVHSASFPGGEIRGQILPDQIEPEDPTVGKNFGFAIALHGDTAVVGAIGDGHAGNFSGAAYVYSRNAGGTNRWGQLAKLTASDAAPFDQFGRSVAVHGDTVVVGAWRDNEERGAAYVFSRNSGGVNNWGQVAKLTANDAAIDDYFGISVGIDGDTIVVGAYEDDDGGNGSGAAYVFSRNGPANAWAQFAKLTASDAAAGDRFGWSVAIEGDAILIGAYLADGDAGDNRGAAYVFQRTYSGAWPEVGKLIASDGALGDRFGIAVALNGDTAVVGAYQDDDRGSNSGSAYVFTRNGRDNWDQASKLTPVDGAVDDNFGEFVDIHGDTVIVGASEHDGSRGAAYLFTRNFDGSDRWGHMAKLMAGNLAPGDQFGFSVTLSGETALVGALGVDNGAGNDAGSAFAFSTSVQALGRRFTSTTRSESLKVDPPSPETAAEFGASVAVDGDIAVVGAPLQDAAGADSGSVHLYERHSDGSWTHAASFVPIDAAVGDRFGTSVAIAGDTVAVGAPQGPTQPGAVYLFYRRTGSATLWGSEVEKLTASDGVAGDNFGRAVDIDGDTIIVGAPENGSGGAAYVFSRYGDGFVGWDETSKLIASDTASDASFGSSVAVRGDTIIIGAPGHDSGGADSGAAYLFARNQGGSKAWGEVKILSADDAQAGALFGTAVDVHGDLTLIGAPGATTNNRESGAAYLFERDFPTSGAWDQMRRLGPAGASDFDRFGHSVAIDGDLIVIGAENDDAGAGTVRWFARNSGGPGVWGEHDVLFSELSGSLDHFGRSVAVHGDTVIVGTPEADSPTDSGRAHIFTVELELDYGDAPDLITSGYPTRHISGPGNGARHGLSPLRLGNEVTDAEADGQPNADASGDDGMGTHDERGVDVGPLQAGGALEDIDILVAGGSGYFNGWFDWNGDSDWLDAGEHVYQDLLVSSGSAIPPLISIPQDAVGGQTYARFRLSTLPGLSPIGFAPDGEVEDHAVQVEPLDTDGDGMPDNFENANGLDPEDASDAHGDQDQDGVSNLDEYNAGMNPNDADSDNDDIRDGLDVEPTTASTFCNGPDAMVGGARIVTSGEHVQCAAATSITVDLSGIVVEAGGRIDLIAPQISFRPGNVIRSGGVMKVYSENTP